MSNEQITQETVPVEQATTETAQPTTTPAATPTAQPTPSWKDSISEEYRKDPNIEKFTEADALAKSYINAVKMIGQDKIAVPNKNSTEEAWEEAYTKLGRPEDPSKYTVSIPEDYQPFFEEKNLDEFKNVAHKIGLNDKQVGALLEYQMNTIKHEEENEPAEISRQKSETESVLKQEWGYDYDKKVAAADRALKVYGDDELRYLITNSSAGNNPAVIRFFARLGQEVTEDMAQNTQNNRLSVSPLDAKDEIAKIMSDANHAYHKGDETAVEKVRQLHEKAYGN